MHDALRFRGGARGVPDHRGEVGVDVGGAGVRRGVEEVGEGQRPGQLGPGRAARDHDDVLQRVDAVAVGREIGEVVDVAEPVDGHKRRALDWRRMNSTSRAP